MTPPGRGRVFGRAAPIFLAAVLASATTAIAGAHQAPSATVATVCVKDPNGQLRLLAEPGEQCGPGERRMEWTVGGEVTAVSAGSGLAGGGDEGDVTLQFDPGVVQSRIGGACGGGSAIEGVESDGSVRCTAPPAGKIFAGFNDGLGVLPTAIAPVAELAVPNGDYAVFAKLGLVRFGGPTDFVFCRLSAGEDFDELSVQLNDPDHALRREGMALELVHRFDVPDPPNPTFPPPTIEIVLSCKHDNDEQHVLFEDLKIIAIQGSLHSNVFLAQP